MKLTRFELSPFWASVASVLTGTAIAQAIPVVGSLVIARQYIPTEFGVFAVWLGVVSVLAVILTGRFETSLAIESDGEPRRLAVFSIFVTILLTSFICAVLLVGLCLLGVIDSVPGADSLPIVLLITLVPTSLALAFF